MGILQPLGEKSKLEPSGALRSRKTSSLGMGVKVIPVRGWSAKEPPSELSKCQVIKPPMCKAFQAAPPRAALCTHTLFRGPPTVHPPATW